MIEVFFAGCVLADNPWFGEAPKGAAIVNADAGPIGARVVKALREGGAQWTVETSKNVSTAGYAAVIKLPVDLSSSITSLVTSQPHRAQLVVDVNQRAKRTVVNDAVDQVTNEIRMEGIRQTLSTVATARNLVRQASFTTQMLAAGVQVGADQSQQFRIDANRMLDELVGARTRALEFGGKIAQVNAVLGELTSRTANLSKALDSTGITVGQATQTATLVNDGLVEILPALRSLPFSEDPRVAAIIAKLEGLRALTEQTSDQLYGFASLSGIPISADTALGTLLHNGMDRLSGISAELNTGAELAKQMPALADQGSNELQTALQQYTEGLGKMRTIVGNLNEITDKALNEMPAPASGQSTNVTAINDPVQVIRN